MSKIKTIAKAPSKEMMAELNESFPVEEGYSRSLVPRLKLISQDVTEEVRNKKTGKKEIKVIIEAGTFVLEKETDEEDEDGKKIWEKTELGDSIKGTIIFSRKQLSYYDSATQTYTSSPIYDNSNEEVPLFCGGSEIDRGLPAELQAREEYRGLTQKGKPKSNLEETKILYVIYDGEMYQMNLRGTSMYAFLKYAKSGINIPLVLTEFGSEPKEVGTTKWNQMTFKAVKDLDAEQVEIALEKQRELKKGIADMKAHFSGVTPETTDGGPKRLKTGDFGSFDENNK